MSMFMEFDHYPPRNQCVVTLLATLSLVERSIIRSSGAEVTPSIHWSAFLECASQSSFMSSGEPRQLDEYFLNPRKAVRLGKNDETLGRVAKLVAEFVSGFYFSKTSPFVVAEKAKEPPYVEIIRRLRLFSSPDNVKSVLEASNPDRWGRGRCIREFLSVAVGKVPLRHPDHKTLSIFDDRAIKSEFHGLKGPKDNSNWGLFAVIREARGWAERNQPDVNIIVRDVLWLLPPNMRDPKSQFVGFYVSVIDKAAFVVYDSQIEENSVIVLCTLNKEDGTHQRCKLMFADFTNSHPLQVRHGIITGMTGDSKQPYFAAWKALLIRPDWPDTSRLESLLSQLKPDQAELAHGITSDNNAAGVIFSNELRRKNADVQSRREGFRRIISDDAELTGNLSTTVGGFMSEQLKKQLGAAFDVLYNKQLSGFSGDPDSLQDDLIESAMDVLTAAIKQNWLYINPAQIITYKKALVTRRSADFPKEMLADLQKLLDRTNITEYPDS